MRAPHVLVELHRLLEVLLRLLEVHRREIDFDLFGLLVLFARLIVARLLDGLLVERDAVPHLVHRLLGRDAARRC